MGNRRSVLPMSQVHQSRPVLCKNGIENSPLHLREEKRMAQEVAGKEETQTRRAAGAIPQSDQGDKKRQGRERNRVADPNLENAAVNMYRDVFKFCPNRGTRNDIAVTVTDLDLWKDVLNTWGYWKAGKWIKFNPLSTRKMLSEYERRKQNGTISTSQQHVERISAPEVSPPRVPERSDRGMRDVREGTGVHVRSSGFSLEETLTKALRENDRP